MASWSWSAVNGLTTPGGSISINATSGDTFFLDPASCSGLGVSTVRAPIFNRGQTDGYILLPFFEEGQHLVLGGRALIRSQTTEAAMVTARDTLFTDARTKLKTILQADGSLTFSTGDVIVVRCDVLISAADSWLKTFVLGLVSATPA